MAPRVPLDPRTYTSAHEKPLTAVTGRWGPAGVEEDYRLIRSVERVGLHEGRYP
ncbi:hypothetical protein GT043_08395 [Streptomyces sp. SID2131]|nr:hypothetical protein [Streptomyces sp. SID2131]